VQRTLARTRRSHDSSVAQVDSDYRSPRPLPDEVELELGGFREWLALVGPMTSSPHEGLAAQRDRRAVPHR
jgi:hypothetical protein